MAAEVARKAHNLEVGGSNPSPATLVGIASGKYWNLPTIFLPHPERGEVFYWYNTLMEAPVLHTRDEFREKVFERDNHSCVICGKPAKDAHHIIERRLFSNGGYYLENGASLCEEHHIAAEQTTLSCDEIREKAGITRIVIPDQLYDDNAYDKWGNIILPTGNRLKGELFYDESVQKILKQGGVLDLFQKYVKYPRTMHLPWSNLLKDDRILENDEHFIGREVVCTLKMDGENTTMYNDKIHARSLDSASHETRNWVKGLWARISWMIDDNMRLCGENLYAVHSLKYDSLPSYFMLFSVWVDNVCLSWKETEEYAGILGLQTVPVIYQGIYDREKIEKAFAKYADTNEGYVIRLADQFLYSDFRRSIAKYVRPQFRQAVNNSHGHWISKKIETNTLKGDNS